MDPKILERANTWLSNGYDTQTQDEVRHLMENNEAELTESFYRTLEFGTGGLRGIMGVGTNRMNIYTVSMATQGLSNYLKRYFENKKIKVAVAYDCRNNSELFAQTTAKVFAANGFTVYLFESLRPTPELSFTIRELGCQSGVVITASHNPKEYNGYKAYWSDGAQVIYPHDQNIINEVDKIQSISLVKNDISKGEIIKLGKDMDDKYLAMIKGLSLSPEAVAKHNDLKIVYTPIHGTGVHLVPAALAAYGFTNVHTVAEQNINDGNFPTVHSPNPEEPAALKMAVDLANEIGADIVMATDPDADRQALAVRDYNGELRLLNGNQTAAILTYYLLRRWKELGKLKGKEFIVKTIVTTDLLSSMAFEEEVECFEVLTGFKFIADIIRRNEGKMTFIGGGEESFGYLIGDKVRDKDAVASLAIAAECAAWAREEGYTGLWDLLMDIYVLYGLFKEDMISITRKGQSGVEEIAQMMKDFRDNPPKEFAGERVTEIRDYSQGRMWQHGQEKYLDFPKSNVLQYLTEKGTLVSMRPSGTEPKIKFYISVTTKISWSGAFETADKLLAAKINIIKEQLGL